MNPIQEARSSDPPTSHCRAYFFAIVLSVLSFGCNVGTRTLEGEAAQRIQWRVAKDQVFPPYRRVAIGDDLEVRTGSGSLIRWSPDGQILAWTERETSQTRGNYTDALVLYWPTSRRQERIVTATGIVSISWAESGASLLLGCANAVRTLNSSVWEAVVTETAVSLSEITIPGVADPRNPIYWKDRRSILFVDGGNRIGHFDPKSDALSMTAADADFINTLVQTGSGIAYADSGYRPAMRQFGFIERPFTRKTRENIIVKSGCRAFHLVAFDRNTGGAAFVTHRTQEYDSGILGVYRETTGQAEALVEFDVPFGEDQEVRAIAVSDQAKRLAFTLDSLDDSVKGVWLGDVTSGRLARVSPSLSSSLALTRDGTLLAFVDSAGDIVVVQTPGVAPPAEEGDALLG